MTSEIDWVVLTMGTRPQELRDALDSIDAQNSEAISSRAVVVANGADVAAELADRADSELVELSANVGIPAGRDIGIRRSRSTIVGSLDDDAVLEPDVSAKILAAFAADPKLGAVAIRIVDEDGHTLRRHIPRAGGRGADLTGPVTYFLGGAHALRRDAYVAVGGYFGDLWYGHEEVELSWRLLDAGWSILYLPDAAAYHPNMPISRRADGWAMTARNRVWIARRTLPWPVAVIHVAVWLGLGLVRAPSGCRRGYLQGWLSGWRGDVGRQPIRWATVWQLCRLGRPPVI